MKAAQSVLAVLLLLLVLSGCAGAGADKVRPAERPDDTGIPKEPGSVEEGQIGAGDEGPVEGKELLALVETEEEALRIAELYGIELVSFQYGVAAYHTEEDPVAVIRRGQENGWPALEINHKMHLF